MPRARRASRARRERVIIIGGGAAGVRGPFALRARRDGDDEDDDEDEDDDDDVFDVELLERETRLGGVATTEFVGERVVINDGVQGGTVSYANVARLMRECGVEELRPSGGAREFRARDDGLEKSRPADGVGGGTARGYREIC